MISGIILGLGAIALGMAVYTHWDEIVNWFKTFVQALVHVFTTVAAGVWHAGAAFLEQVKGGMAAWKHKLIYKEDGHFIEEVRVREIQEAQLPEWAKKKLHATRGEQDVTNEVEREMQLKL